MQSAEYCFDQFEAFGTVPGECSVCGVEVSVEADQDCGWCPECETHTVVSPLVVMGLI